MRCQRKEIRYLRARDDRRDRGMAPEIGYLRAGRGLEIGYLSRRQMPARDEIGYLGGPQGPRDLAEGMRAWGRARLASSLPP